MDKRMEELYKKYIDKIEEDRSSAWRNQQDYDRSFLFHLQKEVQDHWQFMSWLKQTYPEVLEAWVALHKLKGE